MDSELAERFAGAMEALADEIAGGIGAITRNALPALEGSIARQRALCPLLVEVCRSHFAQGKVSLPDTDTRVAKASARLRQLNREYAALLEHSVRTLRMLQALYQTARADDPAWQDSGRRPQQGLRRWQG